MRLCRCGHDLNEHHVSWYAWPPFGWRRGETPAEGLWVRVAEECRWFDGERECDCGLFRAAEPVVGAEP